MKKVKSTYNYSLYKSEYLKPVIAIIDENWGMSVTNDIENVVDEIGTNNGFDHADLCGFVVVYRDSEGEWCGWDQQNNDFYFVGGVTEDEAIMSALAHRKNI